MSNQSFIYDYVRTPFGRYGKALADVRPDDLAALVVGEIAKRNQGLDPGEIDDIYFGDANAAGEDNRNVARMAALLAGFPTSVSGVTLNRLCGSGMEAVIQASRAIAAGDAHLTIAGGVESMTRAPWVLLKNAKGFPAGNETLHSTTLGWRMVNPKMDKRWTVSLGETAEILADRFEISRDEQDEFAVRSHQKATAAWANGQFENQIISVGDFSKDENVRADANLDSLAGLKPAFRENGSVTAGNSSPLSDGAAALIIADEISAAKAGLGAPLARIASRAVAANDPNIFGIAPVEAANRALEQAGYSWSQVDFVELNEAFAAQTLACLRLWKDLDPAKLNVDGGAIAIGHPLGASGARIVGQLARKLEANGGGIGVATICIGVGQGLAVVLER
jgi:acetyl-CoA acetyltransferase family protein